MVAWADGVILLMQMVLFFLGSWCFYFEYFEDSLAINCLLFHDSGSITGKE